MEEGGWSQFVLLSCGIFGITPDTKNLTFAMSPDVCGRPYIRTRQESAEHSSLVQHFLFHSDPYGGKASELLQTCLSLPYTHVLKLYYHALKIFDLAMECPQL
ncbi:hypothetical protein HGM15179_008547 [Zosterops borbonicus]|uniref:Uncharacterized protein n=1 Tax=Zosterops borbonicus TaxID=364589 RepID=A0A8K1LM20_9PASS|nr:hypothetical protein HGM15179_008547 [Zosterops borbonicus]